MLQKIFYLRKKREKKEEEKDEEKRERGQKEKEKLKKKREDRSLKFMFPSASAALSEGAMREKASHLGEQGLAARFRKRLPLISLSYARSLAHSTRHST